MASARVKIRPIGDGLGFIVPKRIATKLNLKPGVTLHVVHTEFGAVLTKKRPKKIDNTSALSTKH